MFLIFLMRIGSVNCIYSSDENTMIEVFLFIVYRILFYSTLRLIDNMDLFLLTILSVINVIASIPFLDQTDVQKIKDIVDEGKEFSIG